MKTNRDYLIEINETEFHNQIGDDKKSSTVNFQNLLYKKGPTYSLSMRPQALNYCQNNKANNLKSLIVENSHFITVWSQTVSSENATNTDSTTSPETVQKVPTKTITRRYRGQTYEVEIPDYAALKKNHSQKQTQRKKYRGQYIN